MNGAYFGSILGNAIGGITGGWRGSNVGTIVGMAAGGMAGAAIGNQTEKSRKAEIEGYHQRMEQRTRERGRAQYDRQDARYNQQDAPYGRQDAPNGTGYSTDGEQYGANGGQYGNQSEDFDPTGGGDDRLMDFQPGSPDSLQTCDISAAKPQMRLDSIAVCPEETTKDIRLEDFQKHISQEAELEIRNVRFIGKDHVQGIKSKQTAYISFEIFNIGNRPAWGVRPVVEQTSQEKGLEVSPTVAIEQIRQGKGMRYTAMVRTNKRIKAKEVAFKIYALYGKEDKQSKPKTLIVEVVD